VAYDCDLDKVEKIALEVAQEVIISMDGCIKTAEPLLRFQSFADAGIKFSVSFQITNYTEQFRIRHEFIKKLHARFRDEKIEVPSTVRTVFMKENKSE
jgi:small-conductance mechanosensitive channel